MVSFFAIVFAIFLVRAGTTGVVDNGFVKAVALTVAAIAAYFIVARRLRKKE
jgi:hypothetical protein